LLKQLIFRMQEARNTRDIRAATRHLDARMLQDIGLREQGAATRRQPPPLYVGRV
jgi:hypothetical protein